jgi:CDGSH-type Zn-finger protein/uncharacterized Fe-S cluster protein YjdI
MPGKIRHYESDDIDVQYDLVRCIHAEECVRRLHAVFDSQKRPWIQPQNSTADAIAETIPHCPSGALHYTRRDGGAPEPMPDKNRVELVANGPLYVRGNLALNYREAGEAQTLNDVRIALCRCGASQHKPFCDNSHRQSGFQTDGITPPEKFQVDEEMNGATGVVAITPDANGPLYIEGLLEVIDAAGQRVYRGSETWLCRCGGSSNKPFCDGTHNRNGFQAE